MPKDTIAPAFDPVRSVTFDLERGQVELADGEAHVLVPVAALAAFLAAEGGAVTLGRSMGVAAMGRVAIRVAQDGGHGRAKEKIRGLALETVVELLGGELALMGLGSLRVERWGQALLFVLDPCSLPEQADPLICGVLEGALSSVADEQVYALVVDKSPNQRRVLVANEHAIEHATGLLRVGAFFTEIVTMLHDAGLQAEAQESS